MAFAELHQHININILENLDYACIKMLAMTKINSVYTLAKYIKMISSWTKRCDILDEFVYVEDDLEIIGELIKICPESHCNILWIRAKKDFSLVPLLVKNHQYRPSNSNWFWMAFAEDQNLQMIKLFHANNIAGYRINVLDCAVRSRNHHVVKYFLENAFPGPSFIGINSAIADNDIQMIQMLSNYNTPEWSTEAMDFAARIGNLRCVKFLHENRTEGCTTDAMDYAAQRGFLDVVKFLNENRTEGYMYAMDIASTYGHIDIVKYLYENSDGHFMNLLRVIRHTRMFEDPENPIAAWLTEKYQITAEQEWLIETMMNRDEDDLY